MEDKKYLVKSEQSIFSRIRRSILNFFHKFKKESKEDVVYQEEFEYQEENNMGQEELKQQQAADLKDFDILKDVVNGKTSVKDLDIETEKRLINLCDNRLKQINEKIKAKDLKIAKIEKALADLKTYNAN